MYKLWRWVAQRCDGRGSKAGGQGAEWQKDVAEHLETQWPGGGGSSRGACVGQAGAGRGWAPCLYWGLPTAHCTRPPVGLVCRPTPLYRARRLEKLLGTPARIYYK